jgi:hypothetical protein
MAGERADDQAALLDSFSESLYGAAVLEQGRWVAVSITWIGSRAQLDGLQAHFSHMIQHFFQGLILEKHGENAKFHTFSFLVTRAG